MTVSGKPCRVSNSRLWSMSVMAVVGTLPWLLFFLTCNNFMVVDAWSQSSSRRLFLSTLATDSILLTVVGSCQQSAGALDMDAFVAKELALSNNDSDCDDRVDKKCQRKMSDDEALCRFGQPSQATGEACLRANMSTKRSSTVDAFGKVDRGDYLRCKAKYVDDGKSNKLVKEWDCK